MTDRHHHDPATQGELFYDFEAVAEGIGKQIAAGVLARIESFPDREAKLVSRPGRMDSLPEDILWQGLGEESAPVFVVYKLLHDAFSNAPQFFRSALVAFLRAQPDRFSAAFHREAIWSVLSALADAGPPAPVPAAAELARFLAQTQKRGIWWCADKEIQREAEWVHRMLADAPDRFRDGFTALKALQAGRTRGVNSGNLQFLVPGKLASYANEVVALGQAGKLPLLDELDARVGELAREPLSGGRPESIPLDLLYTTLDGDALHVRVLARAQANAAARADLRRRALYVRYFLRRAFRDSPPPSFDIRLAFYLDPERAHAAWTTPDSGFHDVEWIDRRRFWNDLCPAADPEKLFARIRDSAAKDLAAASVVNKLKTHFNRSGQAPPAR